jgi:mono/diheme cytochrome c family protein
VSAVVSPAPTPHDRFPWGSLLIAVVIVIIVLVLASVASWFWLKAHPVHTVDATPAPLPLLEQKIPDGPSAAVLRQGQYLTIAGDCVSCHTRPGGAPFEGGLGLQTPFGVIYSPSITGETTTGLGNWTPDQFYRALHEGVRADGAHLYPAFPYPHFVNITRSDSDAILAFLKTVPGKPYTPPPNRLLFPLNIRASLIGWDLLFFHGHTFRPDSSQSDAWNRGAYLVQGPGHCGACHTPTNILGAERGDARFKGGKLDNWLAPDLTEDGRTGLANWSIDELVQYLKTGRNAHSNAGGKMAEVVAYSTSQLSDVDLHAIATYIQSLVAGGSSASSSTPDSAAMKTGAAIYSDACSACHRADGSGQPQLFPKLAGSAAAQQSDPATVIHLILGGGRTAPTPTRPSTQTMPSFAWKMTGQEIADVATYVRNSWGNSAPAVSIKAVADMRKALQLTSPFASPSRKP